MQSNHPLSTIPPGSTIGILGGGQLGRMLSIAAAEMGYHCHIYSPEKDAPAFEVAKFHTQAAFKNTEKLKAFADSVDVVTYEFENIPVEPLKAIATKIKPSIDVLAASQHRVKEKTTLNKLGIATAPFIAVNTQEELVAAIKKLGVPSVLKTATMGYDGKGQWKIKEDGHPGEGRDPRQVTDTLKDVDASFRWHGDSEYILEKFIPFTMEISVIVARSASGEMKCYCPVQNIHKNHILSETIAPAPISEALSAKAEKIAKTIAEGLGLVGLMAVEMFVTPPLIPPAPIFTFPASGGGREGESMEEILVNELAPRPHNSGHWTIDACVTSQFEQTIRAICGLPLGDPSRLCDAKMLNLISDEVNDWQKYVPMPNAKLHLYGKKESRPGRKMGHVTFLS